MDTELSPSSGFEAYLESKKIDPKKFRIGDEKQFLDFKKLYEQVGAVSFTQQKLFLINRIRRVYQCEKPKVESPTSVAKKIKPKILPKKPKLS